jgi:hypothetical protein
MKEDVKREDCLSSAEEKAASCFSSCIGVRLATLEPHFA